MGNILELSKRILAIDLDKSLDKAIYENEKKLLENYQENQLQLGKDENNQVIGLYKSISYEATKRQMNPRASGAVDLKLSGALYAGMKIIDEGNYKVIESNVDYFEKNVQKYGNSWLGWSVTVREINKPLILSSMQKDIRNGLQL